jgi:CRP-like cAMP-binding protein
MLARAYLFFGLIEASTVMLAFFLVLFQGGWSWGAPLSESDPLLRLARTVVFVGIVSTQVGTAFACRTERVSRVSPMADSQAGHLDRPVRHLRLHRLWPVHHVVSGRHRPDGGGGNDPRERIVLNRERMDGMQRIIKEHPFFAGLGEEFFALVTGCAKNVRFESGQYLFHEGAPADELYLLRSGRISLGVNAPGRGTLVLQTLSAHDIVLLYGTRGPNEILFRHQLQAWRRQLDIDIQVTVDRASCAWHGQVGVVTRLIPRAAFNPSRAIAFVCGPEIMMRFSVAALQDVGIAEDAIYLSLERNMKCGVGLRGHCQFGPALVCREGPAFRSDRVRHLLGVMAL